MAFPGHLFVLVGLDCPHFHLKNVPSVRCYITMLKRVSGFFWNSTIVFGDCLKENFAGDKNYRTDLQIYYSILQSKSNMAKEVGAFQCESITAIVFVDTPDPWSYNLACDCKLLKFYSQWVNQIWYSIKQKLIELLRGSFSLDVILYLFANLSYTCLWLSLV